jgi:hypothetical protein
MKTRAAALSAAKAVLIENELARRGFVLLKPHGYELIGPCPVCGGTDRFGVNRSKRVWNCRGCQKGGDVIALAQHLDGSTFPDAIETLTGERRQSTPPRASINRGDDEQQRSESAARIWGETVPLTPEAIAYFHRRRIPIENVPNHGGLRFHPRTPWGNVRKPCIVGRYTTVIGNEPRGIWRRPITGEKPMSLGPTAGCVIRLWPDDVVEQALVLGEGPETVLAAATRITHLGTLLRPAWAAGSAGNLRDFPVLSGIEFLTVLVDNDHPDKHGKQRGQQDAAVCIRRWRQAGREVEPLITPDEGTDFNDLVLP